MDAPDVERIAQRAAELLGRPTYEVEATIRGHLSIAHHDPSAYEVYGSEVLIKRISPDWSLFDTYVLVEPQQSERSKES